MKNPPQRPNSLEIIGALSSMLIHELSNAMTGISGNIQMAKRAVGAPEKLAHSLEALQRSCRRAGEILSEFEELRGRHAETVVEFDLKNLPSLLGCIAAANSPLKYPRFGIGSWRAAHHGGGGGCRKAKN